jgi:hypothetical protein
MVMMVAVVVMAGHGRRLRRAAGKVKARLLLWSAIALVRDLSGKT